MPDPPVKALIERIWIASPGATVTLPRSAWLSQSNCSVLRRACSPFGPLIQVR